VVNFPQSVLVLFGLLAILFVLLAIGGMTIARVRAWHRRQGVDRAGWENMLADCKNLESQGVLSEDEYRKIRTILGRRRSSP
jgi:hypothetical protein